MNKDSHMIYEAFEAKQAETKTDLELALTALKDCYKHFSSEPTDPGHPELLKTVKEVLDKVDQKVSS